MGAISTPTRMTLRAGDNLFLEQGSLGEKSGSTIWATSSDAEINITDSSVKTPGADGKFKYNSFFIGNGCVIAGNYNYIRADQGVDGSENKNRITGVGNKINLSKYTYMSLAGQDNIVYANGTGSMLDTTGAKRPDRDSKLGVVANISVNNYYNFTLRGSFNTVNLRVGSTLNLESALGYTTVKALEKNVAINSNTNGNNFLLQNFSVGTRVNVNENSKVTLIGKPIKKPSSGVAPVYFLVSQEKSLTLVDANGADVTLNGKNSLYLKGKDNFVSLQGTGNDATATIDLDGGNATITVNAGQKVTINSIGNTQFNLTDRGGDTTVNAIASTQVNLIGTALFTRRTKFYVNTALILSGESGADVTMKTGSTLNLGVLGPASVKASNIKVDVVADVSRVTINSFWSEFNLENLGSYTTINVKGETAVIRNGSLSAKAKFVLDGGKSLSITGAKEDDIILNNGSVLTLSGSENRIVLGALSAKKATIREFDAREHVTFSSSDFANWEDFWKRTTVKSAGADLYDYSSTTAGKATINFLGVSKSDFTANHFSFV